MTHQFLFSPDMAPTFEVGGVKGSAVTAECQLGSGDVAIMHVKGRHGRCKSTLNDRFYVVMNGQGSFTVAGDIITVHQDDVVVVPKETEYDFEGDMKVVVFNSPRFSPQHDLLFEGAVKRGPGAS